MRNLLPLVVLAVAALAASQGDESCAASGGDAASCRSGSPAASGGSPARRAPQQEGPRVDLLTQEMEELKALIKSSESKLEILKELQAAAGSSSVMLSVAQTRALTEQLPLLSDVAGEGERTPTAAARDFIVTKTVVPLEEVTVSVEFMALRSQRTPTSSSSSSSAASSAMSSLPAVVLAAAQLDGTVRLFSPSGELLFSFPAGHDHPLTQLAVSPTHEEHLIATGDAGGFIRLHKLSMKQRRVTKEEKAARTKEADERISQFLGSQLNMSVQLLKQVQLPAGSGNGEEVPKLTALAIGQSKNIRQLVAGDSQGRISVFTKNGTLRGSFDATVMDGPGLEGLDSYHNQLVFRAGFEWGYVGLEKLEVKHVDCPKFDGRVASAVVDSQVLSRVLMSDEAGSTWIFNVKNKKDCEFERQFVPSTAVRAPLQLASVRGFTIGLQKGGKDSPASLLALNMSSGLARKGSRDLTGAAASQVVWRHQLPAPVRDWSVLRRMQQGDLVALLSEDGREIEILEMLMQVYTAPVSDPFTSFKMPIIACAIVLVLGYQYMKQKGKGGGGLFGGMGGGNKKGMKEFGNLLQKKRQQAQMKAGRKF